MRNKKNYDRRKFIKTSAHAAAAIGLGGIVSAGFLESCSGPKVIAVPSPPPPATVPVSSTPSLYDQTPLPYAYNALEDIIDARTMEIHYSKHAASYSKALKEAVAAEKVAAGTPVEQILSDISRYSLKMRNNAGGHYNHEMFWRSMRPKIAGNEASGDMRKEIEKTFGSFSGFKTQFSDTAKNRFGSGWAWLYKNADGLHIGSTPNQDNPLMDVSEIKGRPLLGLDVWEHAYYLKYQNRRPEYIERWWDLVNWDYVTQRFAG